MKLANHIATPQWRPGVIRSHRARIRLLGRRSGGKRAHSVSNGSKYRG